MSAVAALTAHSQHPASRQVREFVGRPVIHTIDRFSEQVGQGLQGWVHQMHVQIGSAGYTGARGEEKPGASVVHVNINGDHAGYYLLEHAYRKGIPEMLEALQQHFGLTLLSGDQPGEAGNLRKMMGPDATLLFRQQAHDKLDRIVQLQEKGEKY